MDHPAKAGMRANMNTVLIVDDDESFLLSLIDGFKSYTNQFGIINAHSVEEAIAILNKQEIDLVLTDLKMSKMNGYTLVAHLRDNHPALAVIIMTAFGIPDMEENPKEIGDIQYIEKPIDFDLLVTKILKGLEGHSNGFITGVSLGSFLQVLELDKKTCTLTVRSGRNQGIMFVKNGELMDANSNDLSGVDAAFEIISWKNVEIILTNSCDITEQNISGSLGYILLEGSRRQDERGSSTVNPPLQNSIEATLDFIESADIDLGLDDFFRDKDSIPSPSSAESMTSHSSSSFSNPEVSAEYNGLSSPYALREQLIKIRQNAGLTQEVIAEILQKKKSTISRLENVNSRIWPKLSTIEAYAKAAGFKLEINFVPRDE